MSLHPSVIRDAARQLEAAARRLRFLEREWHKPTADRSALARALHEARSLTHAAQARFETGDLPTAAIERLVDAREHFVLDGNGGGERVTNPDYQHRQVGDLVVHSVAAPGTGLVTYRITRLDNEGAWGVVVNNSVRDLTRADVQ